MKHFLPYFAASIFLLAALSLHGANAAPPKQAAPTPRPLWVSAYYAIWVQQAGTLTPEKIDYSALSHLLHFAAVPMPDGTLAAGKDAITPADSLAVITPAHKAGKKVLLSVGGWLTAAAFQSAYSDAHRAAFVANLVQIAATRGYDGLDIDMEPVEAADGPGYSQFIRQLRAQMTAANPRLLLTAAVAGQPDVFARLAPEFDQINLMTYDLAGPWTGFKTWNNSALYGNGPTSMNPGQPFPSASGMVQRFIAAGVPSRKLGIGAAFYGCVWTGANAPGQPIEGVTMQTGVPYAEILSAYYQPGRAHWDSLAQAPYLSVDAPKKQFVTYDNEELCARKVGYARSEGLGGVMLWELGSGYCPALPPGKREPLLSAVKRAWLSGK